MIYLLSCVQSIPQLILVSDRIYLHLSINVGIHNSLDKSFIEGSCRLIFYLFTRTTQK